MTYGELPHKAGGGVGEYQWHIWSLLAASFLIASLLHLPIPKLLPLTPWRIVLLVLLAVALLRPKTVLPLRQRFEQLYKTAFRRYLLILFICGTLFYVLLAWLIFDGLPVLDDDASALIQARIFASGRILLPLPPQPQFFWIHCFLSAYQGLNYMCSMYPVGHPLLLLPGVLLHVPWLTIPLFGGLLVVLTAVTGQALFGERVGRLAGLLALCSPFVAELSATHLNNVPTATLLLFTLWQVVLLIRRGKVRHSWLAGAALGLALLTRPATAAVMGAIIALGPLWYWRRMLRFWKLLIPAVLPVLLAMVLYFAYTQHITGDWRLPGHTLGLGLRGKMGFIRFNELRAHTLAGGWHITLLRLGAINAKLLGWPLPALFAPLTAVFLRRADRRDLWLLLMPLGLLATYLFFWYYEEEFPARYIFSSMPMLLILSARGLLLLAERLHLHPRKLLAPLMLCNLLLFLPAHLSSFKGSHWDVENLLHRTIKISGISNAIVYIDAFRCLDGRSDDENDFFATGFIRNNLDFNGDIIYARNLRQDNHLLAAEYPDRSYYLYRYDRQRHKALLYRLEFDGEEQHVTHLHLPAKFIINPD